MIGKIGVAAASGCVLLCCPAAPMAFSKLGRAQFGHANSHAHSLTHSLTHLLTHSFIHTRPIFGLDAEQISEVAGQELTLLVVC